MPEMDFRKLEIKKWAEEVYQALHPFYGPDIKSVAYLLH